MLYQLAKTVLTQKGASFVTIELEMCGAVVAYITADFLPKRAFESVVFIKRFVIYVYFPPYATAVGAFVGKTVKKLEVRGNFKFHFSFPRITFIVKFYTIFSFKSTGGKYNTLALIKTLTIF